MSIEYNNFFADNYVEEGSSTGLYFPADVNQMDAIIKRIFNDHGLRFVFSNRSKTKTITSSMFYVFGHVWYIVDGRLCNTLMLQSFPHGT